MSFKVSTKGFEPKIMDDADSSDADRSNIHCKLNTFLYIGITCV